MTIKPFSGCFCSQTKFAKLLGRSTTLIKHLRLIGVVSYCRAGILIFRSLACYFDSYLPPNIRRAEIKAVVSRIDNLFAVNENSVLKSARVIRQKIFNTKQKIILLKYLNKLDARACPYSLIAAAEKELEILATEFTANKKELRLKILAAKFPPAVENVLLRRYVDCDSWNEIADSVYSLPYSYILHRRGRIAFENFCR